MGQEKIDTNYQNYEWKRGMTTIPIGVRDIVSEQYEQITEFKRKLLVKHKLPSCIKYQTKREN